MRLSVWMVAAASITFVFFFCSLGYAEQPVRHRLLILADMGNEPDEVQQMAHMIVCSNEFDLEGLIAVTGKFLQPASKDPYRQKLHPELFNEIIDAYEKVLPNLKKHASGWHDPAYLRSIVKEGQRGYGIADTGKGKSSPGSELIITAVTYDDPRPIWVVVNAGSNTLAQALIDYQSRHSEKEVDRFVQKLRVFENGAQDNSGAWICANFPDIHWIRSNYQTYCYGGPDWDGGPGQRGNLGPHTWKPYAYSAIGQHQWAMEHIKCDHGPIGFVWPLRQFHDGRIVYLEGGGTIPWLGLMNKGLFDIDHPHWGGWSGRFTGEKVKNVWSKHASVHKDEKKGDPFYVYTEAMDHWTDPDTGKAWHNNFTPVWRWRQAFFNNFVCRMDWCTQPYDKANHHPVAAFNADTSDTIIRLKQTPGQTLSLDASASTDPDGDQLIYAWWVYKEAGTYPNNITIAESEKATTVIDIPTDAAGKQIHVILEVRDKNKIASLYDYRRIIIDVVEF